MNFATRIAFIACAIIGMMGISSSPVSATSLATRSHRQQRTPSKPKSTLVRVTNKETTTPKKQPSSVVTGVYVDKPVLRGQFHKWGAIVYPLLLGIPLHQKALSSNHPDYARASLLFSFAVESIMVVSATLHTYPWQTHTWHQVCRKMDFTAIFIGIASLYSSMGRILMGHNPMWMSMIEPLVWTCAVVGSLLKWVFPNSPPWANASVFLVQGWATTPCIPTLCRSASVAEACGMVGGGIFVTLGALAYSSQWPRNVHNKAQREIVFGPHELFHVGTLFMVASFWFTMWSRITTTM